MPWEEYTEIIWEARGKVREVKAQLELNLARDIKNNKKDFYRNVESTRKTRDNVGPLQKQTGHLATLDKEKAEILNDFCASVLTGLRGGLMKTSLNSTKQSARSCTWVMEIPDTPTGWADK